MIIFPKSERIYFRCFTENDIDFIHQWHQDPEITRYTGDPMPWDTIESTRSIVQHTIMPQYEKGIGRWAVCLHETNECIGWCGLKDIGDAYDLGYRFCKAYWGKGYASEAALAVFHFFKNGMDKPIIGRAVEENKASIAVLQKTGMFFQGFIEMPEHPNTRVAIFTWPVNSD